MNMTAYLLPCIFITLLLTEWAPLEAQVKSDKPNVLFVIADDLNCNINAYGHPTVKTPHLDRLAKKGVLFENAYTNYPLCAPSRTSMLTGLYPDQTKTYKLTDTLRNFAPDVITLPQSFMNSGYYVARVGKIYHYMNPKDIGTPGHDDPESWHEAIYPRGRDKEEEDKIFSLRPGRFGATLSWLAAEGEDREQTDGKVATEAIKLLRKCKEKGDPFFLAVGFYKPHTPFVAPKKYFNMYDRSAIVVPQVPEGYLETLPIPAQKLLTRFKVQNNLSDSLARCAIQAYYATISFMDAQLGRILDELDQLGLSENTIIVFTSDHGYHMGEHGYYQKTTLFEDADHVPLILSYPKMRMAGRSTSAMSELIDLYPTLTSLAKIQAPEYMAGIDLNPVLQDIDREVRISAFTQYGSGYTVRTTNYRYTEWLNGGDDLIELYDLQRDPAEMRNLARQPSYLGVIEEMKALLKNRIAQANDPPGDLLILPRD
ncbi:MAG: sulfatase [Bacteroidota bacterium]